MDKNDLAFFFEYFKLSFDKDKFIKLTLSKKRNPKSDLNNVFLKTIELKNQNLLSFTYRNTFSDTTKNFNFENAVIEIDELLKSSFLIANLITTENNIELKINKKNQPKIFVSKSKLTKPTDKKHDISKNRKLDITKKYFFHLGITTSEGVLIKSMSDKYRQIEKYVEIFENVLKQSGLHNEISIIDMGAGKGYLTFALYDYLVNTLKINAKITGVETQEKLVEFCNNIAETENFKNLKFERGNIDNFKQQNINVLIALHACDTATDDAIYKGIKANADIIIAAPCCHKQIRKQIADKNILSRITKHGILLERQAELITDGLRALILEANGYKTNVFEFISSEHTGKNIMITAIKSDKLKAANIISEIEKIKEYFGIEYHYLENLLEEKSGDWINQNPICNM
jgi:hypothetical protein